MIEILKSLIDLIAQFINSIYNFEIDFYANQKIKVGTFFILVLLFVLLIYVVLRALGFLHERSDD